MCPFSLDWDAMIWGMKEQNALAKQWLLISRSLSLKFCKLLPIDWTKEMEVGEDSLFEGFGAHVCVHSQFKRPAPFKAT